MKNDEFTRTLRQIMQTYGHEYEKITDKLVKSILYYMEEKGYTIEQAYRAAIKRVNFYKLNMGLVENAVYEAMLKGYGVKSNAVFAGSKSVLLHALMDVAWSADNMPLSERLHGVDKVLHNNIRTVVGNALRAYKTIQQLAMELYDGYNTADNVLKQAELPKYLKKIKKLIPRLYSGDIEAAKKSKLYRDVSKDVRKLKTDALSAAYEEVLKASTTDKKRALQKAKKMLETGKSREEIIAMLKEERRKAMEKAMHVAAQEKTRYYAKRIARTEAARAYYEGTLARAEKDPDIFGFEWELSTAHVHHEKDCKCYDYSTMDIGYGKGIYPKDTVPYLPAHPNCMCHLNDVFVWEVKETDGKDVMPEQPKNVNRVAEALEQVNYER